MQECELRCKNVDVGEIYGIVWKYVAGLTLKVTGVKRLENGEIYSVDTNSGYTFSIDSKYSDVRKYFKRTYALIKKYTELWEIHDKYKRRVW